MPCSVPCVCANTRGGGCGRAVCKGPCAHGGGDRGRGVCHRSPVARSLTGRLHRHTLTPGDSSNPSPTPLSGRTTSPGPEALPELLVGEDCVCPSGGPQGVWKEERQAPGSCAIPWTCGGGAGRWAVAQSPEGAHAGAHSTLGDGWSSLHAHVCCRGDAGQHCTARLLPGPCSPHSVPGRPGTGMHEGLGRGCPCWEVTRGAGATCSSARGGEGLAALDVRPRPSASTRGL